LRFFLFCLENLTSIAAVIIVERGQFVALEQSSRNSTFQNGSVAEKVLIGHLNRMSTL